MNIATKAARTAEPVGWFAEFSTRPGPPAPSRAFVFLDRYGLVLLDVRQFVLVRLRVGSRVGNDVPNAREGSFSHWSHATKDFAKRCRAASQASDLGQKYA
ncbi:hypothetical protein [Streptomyces syringium]|uniref:hypothetical protein n=1 Tax=Streptomyces syringium TaxID=76729 RepID=UPI0033A99D15